VKRKGKGILNFDFEKAEPVHQSPASGLVNTRNPFTTPLETTDYPGLLSDVLDGLLSVSAENWQERCEELAELVRPIVR